MSREVTSKSSSDKVEILSIKYREETTSAYQKSWTINFPGWDTGTEMRYGQVFLSLESGQYTYDEVSSLTQDLTVLLQAMESHR